VDVGEPELQARDRRLREGALGRTHAGEAAPQACKLLLDTGDLLRRRLRDAVDEGVDGGSRRALAGHDERRLAGEGREQHAPCAVAVAPHRLEAERGDGGGGDGALSCPGVAEQAEHLLPPAAVAVPLDDRGDGGRLLRR
jgi:hypothetical protein